jgi:hypothetical protein
MSKVRDIVNVLVGAWEDEPSTEDERQLQTILRDVYRSINASMAEWRLLCVRAVQQVCRQLDSAATDGAPVNPRAHLVVTRVACSAFARFTAPRLVTYMNNTQRCQAIESAKQLLTMVVDKHRLQQISGAQYEHSWLYPIIDSDHYMDVMTLFGTCAYLLREQLSPYCRDIMRLLIDNKVYGATDRHIRVMQTEHVQTIHSMSVACG